MANDLKIQNGKPVDENIRPIMVDGKTTSLEISQSGDGAKVTGNLEVTGEIKGKTDIAIGDDITCDDITCDDLTVASIASANLTIDDSGDITIDAGGQQIYFKSADNDFILFDYADGAMTMYGGPGAGTDHYLKFDCAANGVSRIETFDEGIGSTATLDIVADGILTLDCVSDINIDAGGGQVYIKKSGTTWGYFDMTTASTLKLATNTNYHLHLESLGTGDVVIDSNGDVDISSNDGNFIMRKGATEFSAPNSAYAGMILGYTRIANNGNFGPAI